MKRADLIFLPDAAAHLSFMAHQFGASYTDAIWFLREIEERRRNEARAVIHERFGAIVRRLRGVEPVKRKPVLEIVRNALAACL